jgi:hypothetical protein
MNKENSNAVEVSKDTASSKKQGLVQLQDSAPISICYKCNLQKKCVKTFGKEICLDCLEKRKTGRKGHSGMLYDASESELNYLVEDLKTTYLSLVRVPKAHGLYVKWYIEHYPKSKGIVGRQLNYLIYNNNKPIGIIGVASPPLHYKKFEAYFNLGDLKPSEASKLFVNNNVYRIVLKPDSDKNIGTKILKLFRERIQADYKEKYKDTLLGIVTFVEPPRTGAMYKADNWEFIGMTSGVEVKRRGENWMNKQYIQTENKKLIFAKRFKKA